MRSGRSTLTNGPTRPPGKPSQKQMRTQPSQRDLVCKALFDLVMDSMAPPAARASAARTLLDEWGRRGDGEKAMSAMTLAEIEDELGAGGKAGGT